MALARRAEQRAWSRIRSLTLAARRRDSDRQRLDRVALHPRERRCVQNFNVISMRYRGLLEVRGVGNQPLMTPFIEIAGRACPLRTCTGRCAIIDSHRYDGCRRGTRRITYVAPPRAGRRSSVPDHQPRNGRSRSRRGWNWTGAGQIGSPIRPNRSAAAAPCRRRRSTRTWKSSSTKPTNANGVGLRLCRLARHAPTMPPIRGSPHDTKQRWRPARRSTCISSSASVSTNIAPPMRCACSTRGSTATASTE